jgi:hypothetical protein
MTKIKFNELSTQAGKSFGPLKRIGLALMFLFAPGSTLVIFAKTFLQLAENYDDDQMKEMMEAIKNV